MEDENPFFAISVDSSDESTPDISEKVPRDFQSEESFQKVKREWRARIECGEIHTTLPPLPLNPRSKPQTQQMLHAIEELYFYKRYAEALDLTEKVLMQKDLVEDFRNVVVKYRRRCGERLRMLEDGEGKGKGKDGEGKIGC
ncbi:hypothetical protein SBOR_8207 [Sclerotinia borealis F-4128]|uniref:Uncharacterized protein n=1 Tax=Sclerotinia borealis (strain F-4128) TaxID=1432307 RepID=W9C3T9_SCLBF|nr:hypothetical protein SBOR_8207 [Sclerotinia borealis F-4128]